MSTCAENYCTTGNSPDAQTTPPPSEGTNGNSRDEIYFRPLSPAERRQIKLSRYHPLAPVMCVVDGMPADERDTLKLAVGPIPDYRGKYVRDQRGVWFGEAYINLAMKRGLLPPGLGFEEQVDLARRKLPTEDKSAIVDRESPRYALCVLGMHPDLMNPPSEEKPKARRIYNRFLESIEIARGISPN